MSSDSLTPNDASNDFPSPAASKSSAARSRPKRSARNLSDQQLEKKRANDREAQRAIRERTRNTITALEQRIQQLEGGQPSVEIAKALKQCDELKRENESLRQQLVRDLTTTVERASWTTRSIMVMTFYPPTLPVKYRPRCIPADRFYYRLMRQSC